MPVEQVRRTAVQEVFAAELLERVQRLNELISGLEGRAVDAAGWRQAFDEPCRATHSLRAAARAAGQGQAEFLAAALEVALADGRDHDERPSAAWFDRVHRALALLRPSAATPTEGEPLENLPPAPADPVAAAAPTGPAVPVEIIRIAVAKLDTLFAQSGELGVAHSHITERDRELRRLRSDADAWRREWSNWRGLRTGVRREWARVGGTSAASRELGLLLTSVERTEQQMLGLLQRLDQQSAQLSSDTLQLGVVKRALQADVMAVRVQPVASLLTPLERAMRDLTRATGKEARLLFVGGDTELDRKILDELRDPLLHMLRNAVDHGIETPDQRLTGGKPRTGTVRLEAAQRGGIVEVVMEDDGAGLDVAQLRASAVRNGLLTAADAAARDDAAVMDLIFEPGFSTRSSVTELSGRGVGMDVVRQAVERLNGQVAVSSRLGTGTRFTLTVPLTLATTRAVLVAAGGQLFAIPSDAIERSGRVRQRDLYRLDGRTVVLVDGRAVMVSELLELLGRTGGVERAAPDAWCWFFVLAQGDRRLAVLADAQLGEQEIVAKSLGWPLRRIRNVGGAAILGSGQTIVILNPGDLLKSGLKRVATAVKGMPTPLEPAPRERQRLLVVDDSLTTRSLVRSILQGAGYDVTVAVDGLAALEVLRDTAVDLVVSDVEMPRMNGFELTARIRADERLRQTPVILITSLGSREHRDQGVAVGADAHIVKGGFDQGQLLATIGRLL